MIDLRLPRVREFIASSAWAIEPAVFTEILDLVAYRSNGQRFTAEEIEARISSRRSAAAAPASTGGVAVISLAGVLVPKANLMTEISGGSSLEQFTTELRDAVNDDTVSAIVLNIDSPGGSTSLATETAAEIRQAAKRKPVVAVANTLAASLAYWLGSQASEFVATPSAKVGAIGVITAHEDITAMQEKLGVKTTLITAGKYKGELNPLQPLTDEARAHVQHVVDQTYGQFVNDVARGRNVTAQDVQDGFGQGRIVSAQDALRLGMVDRLATLDAVLTGLVGDQAARRRTGTGAQSDLVGTAVFDGSSFTGDAGIETSASGAIELDLAAAAPPAQHAPAPAPDRPTRIPDRATAAEPTAKEQSMKTIAELVARQDEIKARQEEIDTEFVGKLMDADADAEFKTLDAEYADNKAIIEQDRARKAAIEAKAAKGDTLPGFAAGPEEKKTFNAHTASTRRVPENIYALDEYRNRGVSSVEDLNALYRDGAMRAIEHCTFPHPDAKQEVAQEHIERLLQTHGRDGHVARRVLATGSPAYERAFGKMVVGAPLTNAEQHALATYGLQISSDPDGGYALPFALDPTVVPTSNGAVNPYRQLAAVKTTTTNVWKGVSSDGVEVAYDAESSEVDESTPQLAQPIVYAEKAHVFVRFSVEIDADWPAMRSELASMIQDAKDAKEAEKFTTGAGHGSDEPMGIITAVSTNVIPTDGAALALPDIDTVDDALLPRYEPNGAWVANKAFYNAIRQLAGQTFDIYMPLAEGISKRQGGFTGRNLAGYPAWRCSEISNDLTTTSSKIAVLGDWRYFVVVDRVGMSLEVVQHLMGPSGRPTGERGLYGYFRSGSDVISEDAFQVLEIGS